MDYPYTYYTILGSESVPIFNAHREHFSHREH